MKFFGRWFGGMVLLLSVALLAGCETDQSGKFDSSAATNAGMTNSALPANIDPSGTLLHVGDMIAVSFADTPNAILPIEDTIKDDGSITLIYNEKFQAAGKTIGALQMEIRERYVPKYFRYLTVSIKTQDRFYTVDGEVRAPSRQVYVGKMTVLRAIATVGGFTDYANKTKVRVTRSNGEQFFENCKRAISHPDLDREIFPGDSVFVPKKWW